MTKEIQLTQGKVALIDDEDYEWVSQFKWFAAAAGRRFYVRRKGRKLLGEKVTIYLHREILDSPVGMDIDHINGNGLDNRRNNLRLTTRAENMQNSSLYSNSTSGFKGVYWYKPTKNWRASIRVNGYLLYLGNFDDLGEAARAYDKAALEHFGEFSRLNFPEEIK